MYHIFLIHCSVEGHLGCFFSVCGLSPICVPLTIASFVSFLQSWLCLLSSQSSILCRAGLVDVNDCSLLIPWKVFPSPPSIADSFGVYSSWGWHPLFYRTSSTLIQNLLAFKVSIENATVILVSFPLYMTCVFLFLFFVDFSAFSLFCMVSV